MVFKEPSFNSFYLGNVWWSSKNSFLTVSTLGWCSVLQRDSASNSFYFGTGVVVLKELIFNTFYFGQEV